MATGLIDIMKRASLDVMDSNQMCDLRFGTVISVSPLKVQITNQFTIPESLLIVPKSLTNYEVSVSMNWSTGEAGSHHHGYSGTTNNETPSFSSENPNLVHTHKYQGSTENNGSHSHTISSGGERTITINNALKVGDKVARIRKTGGQSYYILDRI